MTSDDLVSFILRYKKGKVFRDFSPKDITTSISNAIDKGLVIIDASVTSIRGLLMFSLDFEKRTLHVDQALTIHSNSLPVLINRACEIYGRENFDTITFHRRGNLRVYNLKQFLNKF